MKKLAFIALVAIAAYKVILSDVTFNTVNVITSHHQQIQEI